MPAADAAAAGGATAQFIDLDSSSEGEAPGPAKRPRRSSLEEATSRPPPASSLVAGPLYLNRLLDRDLWGSELGEELSLQDVFERHPSADGAAPREALVANFMIDLAWLMEECPSLRSVPTLTVLHGDGGHGCKEAAARRAATPGLETRLHAPPLPMQWGTHHSKLALLLYDDCIRVCVRSFNDIFCDAHCKSQGMYVQDFPAGARAGVLGTSTEGSAGDFGQCLERYLACSGGFDAQRLRRYDFSSAAVSLVASVPGYHRGSELACWGHMRLRSLLAANALLPPGWPAAGERVEQGVICQFSSLGSLTQKWVEEFHTTLATTAPWSTPGRADGVPRVPPPPPAGLPPDSGQRPPLPPLWFVAPTVSQVRDSMEGWVAGVSVPIRKANLKPWLGPYWRRWGPAGAGAHPVAARRANAAMPHVKSYCRYAARMQGRAPALAWLCVGSHNLSRAAWGELQKGGSQLAIRSYELSVVAFPRRLAALEADDRRPQGRFFRARRGSELGCALLVPRACGQAPLPAGPGPSVPELPVACPTAVPPAGPPSASDPVWAVDLEPWHYEGLDRFGSRAGERAGRFYNRQASACQGLDAE